MTSPNTAYVLRSTVVDGAMRYVWMPARTWSVEDGLKTVKREHDVAGLVSSVRRPDTRWHPVVGGQKKHGRPGSELWAPGSEL